MTTQAKRLPLPWSVRGVARKADVGWQQRFEVTSPWKRGRRVIFITDPGLQVVEAEECADFAAKTCNAHDDLVAACGAACSEIVRLYCGQDEEDLKDNATYNLLVAALAKARGEEKIQNHP